MSQPLDRCNLSLPFGVTAEIIWSLLTRQTRNLHADAVRIIQSQGSKVQFSGDSLPKSSFLISVNHFSQPGFSVLWIIMAIHSRLDLPTVWIMSDKWSFPNRKLRMIYEGFMAWAFKRIARMYGFIITPAQPPLPENSLKAAIAIRSLVKKYRSDPGMAIGLAPEGRDFPAGKLGTPARGTGLMINELLKIHPQILPVGFYFKEGQYFVNFGKLFEIKPKLSEDRESIDRSVTDIIMNSIAALLPNDFRGDYA